MYPKASKPGMNLFAQGAQLKGETGLAASGDKCNLPTGAAILAFWRTIGSLISSKVSLKSGRKRLSAMEQRCLLTIGADRVPKRGDLIV